jgi:hypothetical protein
MVDLTIRKNEKCVIGLPRCDYVFQSTRRCFVGYGFRQSPLEVEILRRIVESKGMELVEAGGLKSPGQSVFCQKICSQIIISQFCIILVNDDEINGGRAPNANVHLEYGMMLAFNKYTIPFQLADHTLAFNIAGLDTVKYQRGEFARIAEAEIDRAIVATTAAASSSGIGPIEGPLLHEFLLARQLYLNPGLTHQDVAVMESARPFQFLYYSAFSGMSVVFVGNFQALRLEQIISRLKSFVAYWRAQEASIAERLNSGMITQAEAQKFRFAMTKVTYMVIVGSEPIKRQLVDSFRDSEVLQRLEVISPGDIEREVIGVTGRQA